MAVKQSLFLLALALFVTLGHCNISIFRDPRQKLGPVEWGEYCELLIPCNSKNYTDPTYCDNDMVGKCICLPGLIRDETLNRCVSPPSGTCTFCVSPHPHYQTTCTEFAECVQEDRDRANVCEALKTAKRPGKVDGVCKCEDGATVNKDTGRCECPTADRRREIVEGSCKILASETGCSVDAGCTKDAACKAGTCACKDGFVMDAAKHCVKSSNFRQQRKEKLRQRRPFLNSIRQ